MGAMQKLREHKQHLAAEANQLLNHIGAAVWSVDDQKKYDALMDDLGRISSQISAHQKLLDAEADSHFNQIITEQPTKKVSDALKAFALFARKSPGEYTAEDLQLIRNAMSTTTTTEGGYTVASEVAKMVVDSLKVFGGMRKLSTIIQTESGNPLNYPTSDGTAETGEIVAENAAASGGDITFGTAAVNPYKYSSKKIALPWELITDSAIDVVAFVVERLATRLGRITNTHYTTGDGSSKPFGIAARASSGKVGTTGQTLTVIYDDLVDLFYAVNAAYRDAPKTGFMTNDLSLAIIRKLKDSSNRPIFVPSWDQSLTGATPDTILGKPVVVNNDVATMAANAKSIFFGDFSKFIIRDVAGMSIRRFDDSAFALNGQVGFCGWMRTGSNLVDTAAVKYYANSAT